MPDQELIKEILRQIDEAAGKIVARFEGIGQVSDFTDSAGGVDKMDAAHIARLSNLGLDINSAALPIDDETNAYCDRHGLNAVELTLQGGEAYELAFAVEPDASETIRLKLKKDLGRPSAIVGKFHGNSVDVSVDGSATSLHGFDHFREQ